ncbi:LysM peptidoglycan-binding domain-containing protein [Brevibacillus humidisoli]|uniref:LysM peptidoglycan-binding domain-containing protein n=1 Tax=Brevibacillus humidisoli TaxID=2895522 RepID=UPI001E2DD516|nr:LysM peptidoglycan-binding domain-containing protein [Brevibacillus humidisoli]UFJ41229.1 LysM peptidoglycan-binding domain-containing protein [Brevibacillus humidisoli]
MPDGQTIYRVRRGDSLYKIAHRFGITVEALMRANNLTSPTIYIGQTLQIPSSRPEVYTVKEGDTLYQLAQQFETAPEALMIYNRLTTTELQVGQRLRIPVYTEAIVQVDAANVRNAPGTETVVIAQMVRGTRMPVVGGAEDWVQVRLYNGKLGWIARQLVNIVPHGREKPILEILGYYTEEEGPTLPSSYQSFTQHAALISDVGLFHFRIDRENPSQIEKFFTFTDEYMRSVVATGHRNNIKMLPVIHNLLYERGNQEVNKQVIHVMLESPENRQAFINDVIELIQRYNFDGAHLDFEDVNYEDRNLLSTFYQELGRTLKQRGYYYAASVPARTSDRPTNPFSAPFDYAVIGAAVDEFVVMLYNEHGWPGSPPGPPVSIGWMERVVRYTLTKMPASKITAAVSVFGFDFNLTTGRNTYVTYQMAVNLAQRYNAQIRFDEETQTPTFSYQDERGNRHEVWFENAASIRSKLMLANRLGIRGLALWRLGMEDPAMWDMIQREIVVRKSVV